MIRAIQSSMPPLCLFEVITFVLDQLEKLRDIFLSYILVVHGVGARIPLYSVNLVSFCMGLSPQIAVGTNP